MDKDRRKFLKQSSAIAGAAIGSTITGFPGLIIKNAEAADAPWVTKDGPIKVGVLFSISGNLAVIKNNSSQVTLFAIDEINKAGGVAGMQVEPVVVDAKSDIKVYSEKISQLILRDRVIATFGGYTSASRRAVAPIVMSRDHLFYYPTCYEGRECTQNIINTGPLANQHSQDLIPFMVKNFGKKVYHGRFQLHLAEGVKQKRQGLALERTGAIYWVRNMSRWAAPTSLRSLIRFVRRSRTSFFQRSSATPMSPSTSSSTRRDSKSTRCRSLRSPRARSKRAPWVRSTALVTSYPRRTSRRSRIRPIQKFVENYLKSKYGGGGVTHYNMEETYLVRLRVQVWF